MRGSLTKRIIWTYIVMCSLVCMHNGHVATGSWSTAPVASCAIFDNNQSGCQSCFTERCTACTRFNCQESCFSCPQAQPGCSSQAAPQCLQSCTTPEPRNQHFVRCNQPRSLFIPRSAGSNTARHLVGLQKYIHQWNDGRSYVTTASTVSYSHSFRPERIARYLFGKSNIRFSGSQVPDRLPCAFFADYFGLSPTFDQTVALQPTITNIIAEQQLYLGLNSIYPGLFACVLFPLVHTRWDLGFCLINETSNGANTQTCLNFPPCYMSCDEAEATCSLPLALSGTFTFGDKKTTSRFGRISSQPQTCTGLAQLDFMLGRDFVQLDRYHLGLFGLVSLPTGTKPSPEFLFNPILGNGKHLEVGIGLTGHSILFADCVHYVDAWVVAQVTHLFKNSQWRTFDFFRNGPLSRYLLLKEFTMTDNEIQYGNNLITAIDFATRPITSSVSVKGDVSAKLSFHRRNYSFDIGYNLFARSQETVCLAATEKNSMTSFGIKGSTDVCAVSRDIINTDTVHPSPVLGTQVTCIPLQTTASNATICSGGTPDHTVPLRLHEHRISLTSLSRQDGAAQGGDIITATDSNPPVLVNFSDLDLISGTVGAYATHGLFAHIDVSCVAWSDYQWNIGIGGELEIEALACNEQFSLNQWSGWLKTVITF